MDDLRSLLSAHQVTVYRICFQVLRASQDAEDAAQDALLEIVKGISTVRERRALKRWICRVALHTALDHLKRRRRRARHEEARASMKPKPNDQAADAVHDALAQLDDDDRCLLIEKYFEGATLEDIGVREGVSAAAVGKRIDRAKERLKQCLVLAGFAAVVPSIDSKLEAIAPATVVPDMVATSKALQTAIALAGGAAMAMKIAVPTAAAAALFCLTLGAGSGYVVGAQRASRRSIEESKAARPPVVSQEASATANGSPTTTPASESPAPEPAKQTPLLGRLDRFRAWHSNRAAQFKYRTPQDYERAFFQLKEELDGVRELIFADPTSFLEWIGRADHGPCLEDLFSGTLMLKQSVWGTQMQDFSTLPSALVDGLLNLMQSGTLAQRRAFLSMAPFFTNPPPAFRAAYVAALNESYDPSVGPLAVRALLSQEPSASELDSVIRFAVQLKEDGMRVDVFRSIGKVARPEVREWLLATLESGQYADSERLAYSALEWWVQSANSPGKAFNERAAQILGAAMARTREQDTYFMNLYTALHLPIEQSLKLVEQAAALAPNEALRNGAEAVLQRTRKGGASPRELQEAWIAAFRTK